MIYTCQCGKKFQRIGGFKRHRGICEILNEKTHIQKKELEEISDIPPLDEIWLIIKTLVQENKKLKEEIKRIKSNVGIQNKKMKILDWLNCNIRPETSYEEWLEEFEITENDLSKIFKLGFKCGMIDILENILSDEFIKAYNQKNNKLYIYNKNNEWDILNLNEFKTLILKIQKKLLNHFLKWCNKNKKIVYSVKSDEYAVKTKELMGGKRGFLKSIKPLYNCLYTNLKVDFKEEVMKY
tara:strand:+ start:361 stop:1077 length:717 start_codon:yes stop_codon:yes gene_type:complete